MIFSLAKIISYFPRPVGVAYVNFLTRLQGGVTVVPQHVWRAFYQDYLWNVYFSPEMKYDDKNLGMAVSNIIRRRSRAQIVLFMREYYSKNDLKTNQKYWRFLAEDLVNNRGEVRLLPT